MTAIIPQWIRRPRSAVRMTGALLVILVAAPMAADKLEFDVASVKPNKSQNNRSTFNFPLGPGDVYVPNGGFFSATNLPLITYIAFAYKLKGNQMQYLFPQLPEWVSADRFDIQARATGNPGKDQMRLMMRSLLADRFKLAIHTEARQVPVFALVLMKAGATGPQLQPHAPDDSCPTTAPSPVSPASPQTPSPSQTVAGGFPPYAVAFSGCPRACLDAYA